MLRHCFAIILLSIVAPVLATAADNWRARWIGPAPVTRPDLDFGSAEWITAEPNEKGETVLSYVLDIPALGDDVVEIIHAGRDWQGVDVNGRPFYRAAGHLHDWRYPFVRNLTPALKPGRNEIKVILAGEEPRAFIARIRGPHGLLVETGTSWTAQTGAVRSLGRVRDPAFGAELKLRSETHAPAFAKRFTVREKPVSARLRITGVGFYESLLNGTKIGDSVLEPSPTDYTRRVLYSTHDLASRLKVGENDLLILLGHGWYDNRAISTWNFDLAPWRDFPRAIAELEIVYADGSRETIGSDASWRQVVNPVVYDDIYEGEVIDGRLTAGADLACGPVQAVVVEGPKGRLTESRHPPARVVETYPATDVKDLGDGSCLIAFPVNVSGWMKLALHGQRAGDVVSFRYDERVGEGLTPAKERRLDAYFLYSGSTRFCTKDAGVQTDRYICRGEDGEVYEPRFSYKGFRYVTVRGLARIPRPEEAVACFVHTDFETIGSFSCSDETFNRLMEMGVRAYQCNFADGVPTDCPHREKNGWTGDASIASELAQYVFENTAAYEKWLRDILDAQLPSGEIPCIVPTSGWGFAWGNGPAWDSALPVVAWNLWVYRGDRAILDEVYPALVKYLAFTATKADEGGLVRHGLGDWSPVAEAHMPSVEYSSSCYYFQAQRIAAEMARVKGLANEAAAFDAAAEKTRQGLRRKYAHANGVWDNGEQTAQSLALAFGLIEAEERSLVERRLVDAVERAGGHVDMGILGMKHAFRALARAGRNDLAWRMLTNPTAPTPVDWIRKDGTTLWEDWGDGFSRNHIMYGDFVGWAYQYLAGIQIPEAEGSTSAVPVPKAGANGFLEVVFAPQPIDALERCSASVRTAHGVFASAWQRQETSDVFTFTVPEDGRATVRLPGRADEAVGPGTHERRVPRATAGVRSVMRLFRPARLARGNTNVLRLQPIDEASWVWQSEASETKDPVFLKFRKAFECSAADGPLELDVSADERFYLTVDRTFVSRGPHRADVENWQYQSYRIDLAPGRHVIEATVWKTNDEGPLAQLSWRGGFVLKASGAYDARLTTGVATWRVGRLTGISPCGKDGGGWGGGSQWTIVGAGIQDGEPSSWQDAVVVRGPAGEKGPVFYAIRTPGWMLFPSQLPDQTETRIVSGRVVAVTRKTAWREGHIYSADEMRETIDLTKPFTVPAHTRLQFAWDLGDYYCFYPELTLLGGKGARVSLNWSEATRRGHDRLKGQEDGARDLIEGRYIDAFGDTFVSDGRAEARFSVPWFRCGKWGRVDIETQDEPLTVSALSLVESRYPVELESAFSSPEDPSLDAIRRISARAQQMCTHEMLFDCPFYEQQMYPGDSRVQLNVLTAMSRDDRIIKRAIELFDLATRDDGQCPFNWPTRGTQEGAGYTLCYLLMYGDYVMNHADREWLRHRLPGLRKSMAGLEVYENADGLLQDLPGWIFMDWAPGWPVGNPHGARLGEGVSAEVNLMWNLAMKSAAVTERALGHELQAQYWEAKSAALKAKIVERFWDAKRGILSSTLAFDHYSEHAQCLALLGDVLDEEKAKSAWGHLLSDGDLDRCTLYFSFYLIETYFKYGRGDLFLKYLDGWREYVRKGLVTTAEVPDVGENQKNESRSDCHAWAAHPIWFMQTGLAGIRSDAPFFRRVRIAPAPGGLRTISARHPHPDGWISVDLAFADGAVTGTVETPVPGVFTFGGRMVELKAGMNTL